MKSLQLKGLFLCSNFKPVVSLTVQKFRNFISLSLLVLFFAAQSTALHQFSHEDAAAPCKICLVSHQFHHLDFATPAIAQVPISIQAFFYQKVEKEFAFAKANSLSFYHLSRPPPSC